MLGGQGDFLNIHSYSTRMHDNLLVMSRVSEFPFQFLHQNMDLRLKSKDIVCYTNKWRILGLSRKLLISGPHLIYKHPVMIGMERNNNIEDFCHPQFQYC